MPGSMLNLSTRSRYIGFIALAVVALVVSSGHSFAERQDFSNPQAAMRQDPDTSPTPDNAIIADETGLTVEQVNDAMAFQKMFAGYVGELMDRFPGEISGAWMDSPSESSDATGSSGLSTRGHVRFTGEVPDGIDPVGNVFLTGGGEISLSDHYRRTDAVTPALVERGYQNFTTFFAPSDNVIQIEILLPEGAPQPSKSSIVEAVQESVKSDQDLRGRAAIIKADDLALTVTRGSGPIISDQHSRGGNWLREEGTRKCTSGWSVSGPEGDGIITAGHCDEVDQFEEPGVDPYSMVLRNHIVD